jgi:hypothetical protein
VDATRCSTAGAAAAAPSERRAARAAALANARCVCIPASALARLSCCTAGVALLRRAATPTTELRTVAVWRAFGKALIQA